MIRRLFQLALLVSGVFASTLPADAQRLAITIDEPSPLARWTVDDGDHIELTVDGGAFEDTRRPRQMGEPRTRDVVSALSAMCSEDLRDPPSPNGCRCRVC